MRNNIKFIKSILICAFYVLPVISLAQAGSLDLTFAADGIVTTNFEVFEAGSSYDRASDVAIQSDGKIIVAGFSNDSLTYFSLARYHVNGSLDSTFDSDGKVTTAIGDYSAAGYSVAIQNDGKIVVSGSIFNASGSKFALVRYNINGSLDTTFDSDGKVTTDIGAVSDNGYAVSIQSDGKIIVAGESYNGLNYDFALVRYNSNGSLDTTFDNDGKVTTAVGAFSDNGYAVSIQSDGKIVVAGISYFGSMDLLALVRYNINGSLDTTFDTDGIVTTQIGNAYSGGYDLAIQGDGKIVVAGYSYNFNASIFSIALARYSTNGSLDNTFDTDGMVLTQIGNQDYGVGKCVALQSDGKILVAGTTSNNGTFDFALLRYNTNGSLDTSFNNNGIVITDIETSHDDGLSVALQSDGKIIVVGEGTIGFFSIDFVIARYHNTTIPFPSELLSFDAQCKNGKVDLNWVIASQINNDYYSIERSADCINFEILGTLNIGGNSNQSMNYSFRDTKPLLGTSCYRLKQTDLDGQYKYLKIEPVICNDFKELSIYPNPNIGTFIIKGAEQNSEIIITDVLGQIIHQTKIIEEMTEINLSNYTNGVYFITINENEFATTNKIIINK